MNWQPIAALVVGEATPLDTPRAGPATPHRASRDLSHDPMSPREQFTGGDRVSSEVRASQGGWRVVQNNDGTDGLPASDGVSERRKGGPRGPGRPKGGRRASDPIMNLESHASCHVAVSQLAEYWCKHAYTINGYIRAGRLRATLVGGEYRIKIADALAFERIDPIWRKHSD